MTPPIQTVPHQLSRSDRRAHYGHEGAVLWLTGLSGSGKSTLAMRTEHALTSMGYSCYVLDGDNLRHGLNSDLGFSPEARSENIRRAGEVASLFADAGLVCICAFISPYLADRVRVRQTCGHPFHEVYVAADLASCAARDPKGLYQRASSGALHQMTGISAPYEPPQHCELTIETHRETVQQSTEKLMEYITRVIPLHCPTGTA